MLSSNFLFPRFFVVPLTNPSNFSHCKCFSSRMYYVFSVIVCITAQLCHCMHSSQWELNLLGYTDRAAYVCLASQRATMHLNILCTRFHAVWTPWQLHGVATYNYQQPHVVLIIRSTLLHCT